MTDTGSCFAPQEWNTGQVAPGDQAQRFADLVYAALAEVGEQDCIPLTFHDGSAPYLEYDDDDYTPEQLALIVKAEKLAHQMLETAP
jgi:hypothetical protein